MNHTVRVRGKARLERENFPLLNNKRFSEIYHTFVIVASEKDVNFPLVCNGGKNSQLNLRSFEFTRSLSKDISRETLRAT